MESSQGTSRPQTMKDEASDSKWSKEGRKDKMDFAHSQIILDDTYLVDNQSHKRPLQLLIVDRVQGTDVTFKFSVISTFDHTYMLEECKGRLQNWIRHSFREARTIDWSIKILEGVEHITDQLDIAMHQLYDQQEFEEEHPPREMVYRYTINNAHFPANNPRNNNVGASQMEIPDTSQIPIDEEMKDEEEVKFLMEIITIED